MKNVIETNTNIFLHDYVLYLILTKGNNLFLAFLDNIFRC